MTKPKSAAKAKTNSAPAGAPAVPASPVAASAAKGKAFPNKGLVDVAVARGRTIQRNGLIHMPGAWLKVEPEEALRLIAIGAARAPNDDNAAPYGLGPDFGKEEDAA